jgi:hypothetical protein
MAQDDREGEKLEMTGPMTRQTARRAELRLLKDLVWLESFYRLFAKQTPRP